MLPLKVLIIVAPLLVQTFGFRLSTGLDGRIVGGEDANIEDFPYQISLLYYGKHRCGGSILKPQVVLTAGHCVYGTSTKDFQIRAGSSIDGSGGQIVTVSRVDYHEQFDRYTLDYDVSVVQLAEAVNKDWTIKLQPLGQEVPAGTIAVVTGWGVLYSGGPSPSHLQKVEVAQVRDDECNVAYEGLITSRMTCYALPGKDACNGDSGGPLVIGGLQVGIVSWGYGCAFYLNPGVYAKISESSIHNYITKFANLN